MDNGLELNGRGWIKIGRWILGEIKPSGKRKVGRYGASVCKDLTVLRQEKSPIRRIEEEGEE